MAKIKVPKSAPKGALPEGSYRLGDVEFDPRFDKRKKEQERIKATEVMIEPRGNIDPPTVSLVDYEGYPFVTSMSDRSRAGGVLTGIEGVTLNRPVDLLGGQDYMFENPGQVWASAAGPVRQIMAQAAALKEATGRDPLYMPWRMAPTGSDFASMSGETMLNVAEANMGKRAKQRLDKQIKQFIPDWKGVDSDVSIEQFRSAPDTKRKAIKNMMDVDFRDEGGLGIGQARLAVTDPRQLNAPDSHIMNVGRIFADEPIIKDSGHVWYPRGVPGEGLGIIDQPRSIFELLPEYAKERGIPDPTNPRQTDIRSMQMKPYGGIITDKLLKSLGLAQGGMVEQALTDKVESPAAKAMLEMDLARLAVMKDKMAPKKMAEGGIMDRTYKAFVPAQARTFIESLAGDESPITENNFSESELDMMRDAIMRSRRDRMATNQRLYHEAFQNADAKERLELLERGVSPKLDQTVGYQHYPGSPTSILSDFDPRDSAAIRNTLGRFAYDKDAEGNLMATDLYKFRDDLSGKTRPSADYADMGTGEKLWTLAKDTFTGAGLDTILSRTGSAFLGNKPGRPVKVNLGKAPFADGGQAPSAEEMLIEMMERGYGKP